MRPIKKHPPLPQMTAKKLEDLTQLITDTPTEKQKGFAEKKFKSIRSGRNKWFSHVLQKLQSMAGPNNRCMYCSDSAASDIDHFRPKSRFPEQTFLWENMLWACAPCNRHKGNEFPVDSQENPLLINPTEDDVWEFFTINQYGRLRPRFDLRTNRSDEKAERTLEVLKLELESREHICTSRRRALREIETWSRERIVALRCQETSKKQIAAELQELRTSPLRPDVVDYFLNGLGRDEEPFHELFQMLDEEISCREGVPEAFSPKTPPVLHS